MPYPFPLKDLTGQRFGRLQVLELLPYAGSGKGRRWLCQCDCGKQHVVRSTGLTTGDVRSCGCLYRESIGNRNRTHGRGGTPEYRCWTHIKTRCLNPNQPSWKHYGGRGITICDEWANSFEQFLADMGPRPSPEYSIERIDNEGPYAPWNCRWATASEQALNTRHNRLLTHNGKTQTLIEWSRETGISIYSIGARIKMGWSIAEALTRPLRKDRRRG